jgi:hypothetical protein
MLFFADKVIQASEGIRGTVVELSMEVGSDEEEVGTRRYKLLDADEKVTMRGYKSESFDETLFRQN